VAEPLTTGLIVAAILHRGDHRVEGQAELEAERGYAPPENALRLVRYEEKAEQVGADYAHRRGDDQPG
jgi:hypothetical protein